MLLLIPSAKYRQKKKKNHKNIPDFIIGIRSNETHGNEVVPGEYSKKKVKMISPA